MFIRRNTLVSGNYITGIVLMLALVPVGMCQTTSVQGGNPAFSDTVEEIIVYGEKSLTRLRHEHYRAEENFFAVFNSINGDDSFDVECESVVRLVSYRRHHLCMPKFARKFEADMTARMIEEGRWDVPPHHWTMVKKKDELLWKEIATLVLKHPELRKALTELDKAKRLYDSERQRRRQKQ